MADRMLNVAHSSASANFEALLLDMGGLGTGPTEQKTIATFQVLDRFIPQLGVFSEVLKLCRNEIFDAVYSKDLTGSCNTSQDGSKFIQRLPYFVLLQRLRESFSASEFNMKQEIQRIQDDLSHERSQLLESQADVQKLEDRNRSLNDSSIRLNADLEDARNQIRRLTENMEQLKKKSDERESHLNREIIELKFEVDHLSNEINYLQTFKNSYDKLQNAVQTWSGPKTPLQLETDENPTNLKLLFSYNMETCTKLDAQLQTVRNALIDEYDEFLEGVKEVKLQFLPKSESSLVDLSKKDGDEDEGDDDVDHRMMVMREKFIKNIGDIEIELRYLDRDRKRIQEQLQQMDELEAAE